MSFKKLSLKVKILDLISFLANLGIGMLNFGLIFYLRDRFGTPPGTIGLISGLWAAAYLGGCFSLRKVSERLSPLKAISLAAGGMGLFSFIMLFLPCQELVFGAYILFGFITALYWPPLMGWLSAGLEGRKLNQAISSFNLSWSSGVAVGPYLGGVLLSADLQLPLLVVALVFLLMLIIILVTARGFSSQPGKEEELDEDGSTPLRFACWVGIFASYLLHGGLLFIFPLYYRDVLGFSETGAGSLLFVRLLISASGFHLLGRWRWWHHNPVQVVFSTLALGVVTFLFSFPRTYLSFLPLFFLFGVIFSLHYSSSIYHGVHRSLNREGRMAVHEGVLTAGLLLGSGLCGYLYQSVSMAAAFRACAVLVGGCMVLQLVLIHRYRGDIRPEVS